MKLILSGLESTQCYLPCLKVFIVKLYLLPENTSFSVTALQRTDEDVQSHLQAAEQLSEAEGSYKAAIRVITDELQIAYQRFKTLLADYEVLLSMSATFYTSVEKVSYSVVLCTVYRVCNCLI